MSNLVVDGILFYHGGTADLGTNKEVAKNFGPIKSCNIGQASDEHKLNAIDTENHALESARKSLAKQAKEVGANAVICHNYSTSFIVGFSDRLQCVTSAYGDAVLIKPKGAS
ncbi:MAG: heavy metal-binding domain-containing protein [Pseudomonadota bacterium]|nr:heavy metal-binding domain-containing protein [Pseudomonadota bacterium]